MAYDRYCHDVFDTYHSSHMIREDGSFRMNPTATAHFVIASHGSASASLIADCVVIGSFYRTLQRTRRSVLEPLSHVGRASLLGSLRRQLPLPMEAIP